MKRKILSLILAAVMIASVLSFTSCKKVTGKKGFFETDSFFSKMLDESEEVNKLESNVGLELTKLPEALTLSMGTDKNSILPIKLNFGVKSDAEAEVYNCNAELTAMGETVKAAAKSMNKNFYVGLPELLTKVIKYDATEQASDSSAVASAALMSVPEMKEIQTLYNTLLETVKEKISDDKFADSKETIKIDNKDKSVNVITLTLSGNDCIDIANAILDKVTADSATFDIVCKLTGLSNDDFKEALESAKNEVNSEESKSDAGSAKLEWVRKIYDKAVIGEKITITTKDNNSLVFDYLYCDGKKSTTGDFKVVVNNDGKEEVNINGSLTTDKGDVNATTVTVKAVADEQTVDINIKNNQTETSKTETKNDFTVTVESDGQKIILSSDNAIVKDEEKSCEVSAPIKLEISGMVIEFNVTMSGTTENVTVDATEDTAVYDITNQEDLAAMVNELLTNVAAKNPKMYEIIQQIISSQTPEPSIDDYTVDDFSNDNVVDFEF